jgi:hypothetical protein
MGPFTSIVAHLMIADCRPNRLDRVIETCGKDLLPAAEKGMGYRGSYLLVSRDTCRVIALSLWDTASDALTFQGSKPCQSQLLSIGDCFAVPVQSQLFDIAAQA